MRVNPQYLNNVVGALDQTTAVQQQLTEEISSGNAVQQLSDNPIAVGQNVLLSTAISAAASWGAMPRSCRYSCTSFARRSSAMRASSRSRAPRPRPRSARKSRRVRYRRAA